MSIFRKFFYYLRRLDVNSKNKMAIEKAAFYTLGRHGIGILLVPIYCRFGEMSRMSVRHSDFGYLYSYM